MGGRATRHRRGVPADRVNRQRAGIRRLNAAFGRSTGDLAAGILGTRKQALLERLGFARPKDAPEIMVPKSAGDPRIVVPRKAGDR